MASFADFLPARLLGQCRRFFGSLHIDTYNPNPESISFGEYSQTHRLSQIRPGYVQWVENTTDLSVKSLRRTHRIVFHVGDKALCVGDIDTGTIVLRKCWTLFSLRLSAFRRFSGHCRRPQYYCDYGPDSPLSKVLDGMMRLWVQFWWVLSYLW